MTFCLRFSQIFDDEDMDDDGSHEDERRQHQEQPPVKPLVTPQKVSDI